MSRERIAALLERLETADSDRREEILGQIGQPNSALRTTLEGWLENRQAGSVPDHGEVLDAAAALEMLAEMGPLPATVGDTVGSVELLEVFGEGGMGTVFRGHDHKLGRTVAVKTVHAERSLEPATRARFRREATTLSQLDHPGICRVYDLIESEAADYLVLEFVEGETLSRWMTRSHALSVRITVALAIAEALAAAHQRSIVHRDLKPENVMVGADGCVKILDFGIARLGVSDESENSPPLVPDPPTPSNGERDPVHSPKDGDWRRTRVRTRLGSVLGTVAYMSPEQARGETVTTASDIFSLGLIFQELFGGEPAHPSLAIGDLLERARRGETVPATRMRADVGALVTAMKAVVPVQRPTAPSVAAQLRWIAARPTRRIRRLALAGGIALLVAAATEYIVGMSREKTAARAAQAVAEASQRRAEMVRDMLLGLFRMADPERSGSADLTVRELLDAAVVQLEERPLDRSEDTAALVGTLGEIYSSLGSYAESLPLLEAARDASLTIVGVDPSFLADVAQPLGQVYGHLSRFEDAKRIYREAIGVMESRQPPDTKRLALLWASLGSVHGSVNELDAANESLERALGLARDAADFLSLDLAELEHRYGNFLFQAERFSEAASTYEAALSRRQKELPAGHPRINALLNNLGVTYFRERNFALARDWLEQAVAADEKALGPSHPDLGYSLSNLADAEMALGRLDQAERHFARSLQIREAALGPDHLRVSYSVLGLARVHEAREEWTEAEKLYQRTLEIRRTLLPAGHPDLVEAIDQLAGLEDRRNAKRAL